MTELRPLLERVRLAVFDFDGVFTDNRVWVNERGEEALAFSRSDGLGLRRLDEVGVRYLILSMESNPIVGARAEKLRAKCVQGVADKLAVLREHAAVAGVVDMRPLVAVRFRERDHLTRQLHLPQHELPPLG